MITLGLCCFIGLLVYVAFANGEVGPGVLGIVIILALALFHSVSVWERKAWFNRTDYWARGGPDRKR